MTYQLATLTANASSVVEQTINGSKHLVAKDVTFIKPMDLAGGYVPAEEISTTANGWHGDPLTINHPKNLPDRPWYDSDYQGYYVPAEMDGVAERKVVGHARNPTVADDNSVSADLAVDVLRTETIANSLAVCEEDAEAARELLNALRSEAPFDVSSQYSGAPLPPGTYDGEYRGNVEQITRTDSIALLPTKSGECSLADGCGFDPTPTANSAIRVPMTANNTDSDQDTTASTDAQPTANNVDVPEKYRFDNPGDAVEMAQEMAFGEESDLAGDELIHPREDGDETVFMPGPSHEALVERLREMGELDEMSGNAIRRALSTLRETLLADDGEIPEAPTATANAADDDIDREDLIDEITANSPLTRDALEARCNDGLQAIHADVMSANNDTDTDTADDDTDNTMSDNSDDDNADTPDDEPVEFEDLSANAREQIIDEAVERMEANRENEEKEELVSEIIANSADFDSDDRETLLDTPLEALKSLKPSGAGAAVPGTGATANAEPAVGGGSDADDYPDGTIGGDL